MERIGLYNIIKTVDGLPEKIKQKYGKPYSSVSTSELIAFLKKEGYINKESLKMNGEYVKPKTTTKKEGNTKKEESKPDTKEKEMTPEEKMTQRINEGRNLINLIEYKKAVHEKCKCAIEMLMSDDSEKYKLCVGNGIIDVCEIKDNGRTVSRDTFYGYGKFDRDTKRQRRINHTTCCDTLITYRNRESEYKIIINDDIIKDISKIKETYIELYKKSIQEIEKEISELETKFKEL